MSELKFSTGLKTYTVNDCCEIQFNPGDSFFVERLFSTMEKLSKRQEDGEQENAVNADHPEKVFELARIRDREMRAEIDGLFGKPVCAALFPGMDVYALADGLPLWANFLMAIVDEIDASLAAQNKMADSRVAKYMAKYGKYRRK